MRAMCRHYKFGGVRAKSQAAHPVLHLRALLHAFDRNASWDVLYAHGGLHLVHVLTACAPSTWRVGMPSVPMAAGPSAYMHEYRDSPIAH